VRLGQLKLDDSLAVIRRHLADPGWRETILLAVGLWGLVREEPERAGLAAQAMLAMSCDAEHAGQNILLAGACLEDVGELGLGPAAAQQVTAALVAAMRDRALPPAVQRDAGFRIGCTGWMPPDLDRFIAIPAGPFLYGEDRRRVEIKQPFAISKYPITNLQFRRFIEAKGYDRRELWSDEGWAWRIGTYDSKATEDYEKRWLEQRPPDKRTEPFWWHDAKWNNPLTPVVGVAWFEAQAYCNWLAKELGKPIRLPTEEEWERAARHTDGREYPWGNMFDRNKLNCAEFWGQYDFEMKSTTIVGQFPEGNTVSGASDMSGNVWEWTSSWYDREQTYRTVRGGSWYFLRYYPRCASRLRLVPDLFFDSVGFRVVSPGSISGF
jgi:formylglycine-generating enzyme required for sulfatase activity